MSLPPHAPGLLWPYKQHTHLILNPAPLPLLYTDTNPPTSHNSKHCKGLPITCNVSTQPLAFKVHSHTGS